MGQGDKHEGSPPLNGNIWSYPVLKTIKNADEKYSRQVLSSERQIIRYVKGLVDDVHEEEPRGDRYLDGTQKSASAQLSQ